MIELAYRIPGGTWKRKTFPTSVACDRWLDRMDEKHGLECIELRWAV